MSLENAARIEQLLEIYGRELKMFMANGDVVRARKVYQTMKGMTCGAKLRLVGIMLRAAGVGGGAAGLAGRKAIEEQAVKLTAETLKNIAYQQRVEACTKAFGFIGKRFLGPLGIAMLVKDGINGAFAVADSMAERMTLSRIALFDDYLEEKERTSQLAQAKIYPEWLATEYLPALHQNNSQYFQHFRRIFPDGFHGLT